MIRPIGQFLRRCVVVATGPRPAWAPLMGLALGCCLGLGVVLPSGPTAPEGATLGAAVAWAQQPPDDKRAQDLARTIMSPFCPGRTLQACPSPYATEWREDIRQWVREGVSSEEIRKRLRARMPDKDLTGAPSTMADSFLPALLMVLAVAALVLLLRKLIRPAAGDTQVARSGKRAASTAESNEALDRRLDDELEALDD